MKISGRSFQNTSSSTERNNWMISRTSTVMQQDCLITGWRKVTNFTDSYSHSCQHLQQQNISAPLCTTSHSQWGHPRLGWHSTFPGGEWLPWDMLVCGTQELETEAQWPCLTDIIQGDRPVCRVEEDSHEPGFSLLTGFFNFFSQFYTLQALGIHLASYCSSPWLQQESERLAVHVAG